MHRYLFLFTLLLASGYSTHAHAEYQWLKLPPTPVLPKAVQSGYAPINGVKIWYATYGHGQPVILLHGGLANSNYWGNQIPVLAKRYNVIVMDTRGHGRSTHNDQAYSYELMASDVIGLMNVLKIRKAAIIGWSDGAITGLYIAVKYPERLTKLFAFAANSIPSAVKSDLLKNPVFRDYIARTKNEYKLLSPTANKFRTFFDSLSKMSLTQPNLTKEQLRAISVPTWIVAGEHDEVVKRKNTEFMAAQIPHTILLIQSRVSHFSFLQNPDQFNYDVLNFLEKSY